ncbi:hypothetical protein LEMLEM_LOCUS3977 [Lemmus lemmus]
MLCSQGVSLILDLKACVATSFHNCCCCCCHIAFKTSSPS